MEEDTLAALAAKATARIEAEAAETDIAVEDDADAQEPPPDLHNVGQSPLGLAIDEMQTTMLGGRKMVHSPLLAQLPTPAGTPTESGSPSPSQTATAQDEAEDAAGLRLDSNVITTANKARGHDLTVDTDIAVHGRDQPPSSDSAGVARSQPQSATAKAPAPSRQNTQDNVRRLSASKMQELASSPDSLPIASIPDRKLPEHPLSAGIVETAAGRPSMADQARTLLQGSMPIERTSRVAMQRAGSASGNGTPRPGPPPRTVSTPPINRRKSSSQPPNPASNRRNSFHPTPRLGQGSTAFPPLPNPNIEGAGHTSKSTSGPEPQNQQAQAQLSSESAVLDPPVPTSPVMASLPLPPLSVPTFLQLELAGQRPSPLYIYQSYSADIPYESSAVKLARLKNFLLLPGFLERTILFGALACVDAWLWTFTILPIRFVIAVGVLAKWWVYVVIKEARWSIGYVWYGIGRWWRRGARGRSASRADDGKSSAGEESRSPSRVREVSVSSARTPVHEGGLQPSLVPAQAGIRINETPRIGGSSVGDGTIHARRRGESRSSQHSQGRGQGTAHSSRRFFRHRRTKSTPSGLTSFHKADILQGLVIVFTCVALMHLDASRMYHSVRAQSAIKLYVIYNGLEVGDRLLSALGQDIFECLFSSEVLARDHRGRSKVMVPFGMFILALLYNFLHSVCLFYQVITLNVAVNSYSNALLTLLISNQFVEIKSSVFKRFEKENVFQLTCADIVERFQLWLMLMIIAMRNIVEVGGLTIPGAGTGGGMGGISGGEPVPKVPLHSASILPASFTALPSWLWSGEVLSPFFIVTGSETIVDWIKHAYINKFNNIKPNFHGRVLDILCKDYYTNAFVTPSLTRRLGLPLLPLSCLFIRASVQTYHMFLATHLPAPLPPSTQTSLTVESSSSAATPSSQAVAASLERLDGIIRNALGRAVHGMPYVAANTTPEPPPMMTTNSNITDFPYRIFMSWTTDDAIALVTMLTVFFLAFLVLLVLKLVLGMTLLRYSRGRYAAMRRREHAVSTGKQEPEQFDQPGSKRVGGFGHVEVGEDRRAWLYDDDPEGLKKAQATEKRNAGKREKSEKDLGRISRYEMVAKRIW
ncbi:hypothetical protein MCOR17_000286 [Pyricularia oryzae]|nr:hypothetical protein MCOR17_000286 [Pyricularia oryzae]